MFTELTHSLLLQQYYDLFAAIITTPSFTNNKSIKVTTLFNYQLFSSN